MRLRVVLEPQHAQRREHHGRAAGLARVHDAEVADARAAVLLRVRVEDLVPDARFGQVEREAVDRNAGEVADDDDRVAVPVTARERDDVRVPGRRAEPRERRAVAVARPQRRTAPCRRC